MTSINNTSSLSTLDEVKTSSKSSSNLPLAKCALPFLLFSASSISFNGASEMSNINTSTVALYYNINDTQNDTDILYSFISNLMSNSQDLDGRIVDMVNENFWDLI